jgi:hypothetical protein
VADINVERRERSVWPWIIGLVILALLIWLLWSWMRDDTRDDVQPIRADTVRADTPVIGTVPPPVTETEPGVVGPEAGDPAFGEPAPGTAPGEPGTTAPGATTPGTTTPGTAEPGTATGTGTGMR